MSTISHHRFPVDERGVLDVVFHEPDAPVAWVIALHGLESDKEGSKYPKLAERLDPFGVGLIRFDFRGCGLSSGTLAESTVASRIEDARTVMLAARSRIGGARLGLFGSSMGGYVALFLARDPAVQAVVTLAAPENLDDLAGRHGNDLAHLHGLAAEYERGEFRSVPEGIPGVLLIHGTQDETVPFEHAERIWRKLAEPRSRLDVEGCGHRFSEEAHLNTALDASCSWFREHLLKTLNEIK